MKVAELMGRTVLVEKVLFRQGEACKRWWEPHDVDPRAGWITGERWLLNGYVTRYASDPTEWKPEGKAFHCILVTYWPNMKPVPVPLDGFRFLPIPFERHDPRPSSYRWTFGDRQDAAMIMRGWPRDAKGRWLKREAVR